SHSRSACTDNRQSISFGDPGLVQFSKATFPSKRHLTNSVDELNVQLRKSTSLNRQPSNTTPDRSRPAIWPCTAIFWNREAEKSQRRYSSTRLVLSCLLVSFFWASLCARWNKALDAPSQCGRAPIIVLACAIAAHALL